MSRDYKSPHPNLTAEFQLSDEPGETDDQIEFTDKADKVIGWVQILGRHEYGTRADQFSYTIPDPANEMRFLIPGDETFLTYDKACAAFVARCDAEGIVL